MPAAQTRFERMYLLAEPFIPVLGRQVRARLRSIARLHRSAGSSFEILDVGGRKSHYTVAVDAAVTVSDLPRRSELQHKLHLGVSPAVVESLRTRRSNISRIVYDDMTSSCFRDHSFDCVVAIEVLEHVERDADFLAEVYRVLKPNGIFVMTTPNGDFVPNHNPDHRRHYKRSELEAALNAVFDTVDVRYAVRFSKCYNMGLRSWSAHKPLQTVGSMLGNLISGWESRSARVEQQAQGAQHLFATAGKAPLEHLK